MSGEHPLDVVVFGATGVTGHQVAVYLAERAEAAGARWAAAGRDPSKVEERLAKAGVSAPEVIRADVNDPESLAAMAARAKVVVDVVGPYVKYGRPVIEACVANRAHYVDLTGEIQFAARMRREFDEPARAARVKLVEVCGYEALPADLSVLLAADTARERWGEELAEADLVATADFPRGIPKLSDIVSGGTMQSLMEATLDPDAAVITDPGALLADSGRARAVRELSPIGLRPRRGPDGLAVGAMLPSAFINPAVIHRTAELTGAPPFRYREGSALPGSALTLHLRLAAGLATGGMQAGVRALARARPAVRERAGGVLKRITPPSGYGPSPDTLDRWTWAMRLTARTTGGNELSVQVHGEGHMGYLATSRMMGETGLLLAEDGATPERFGHLTPASALGTECIGRFEHAGLRIALS